MGKLTTTHIASIACLIMIAIFTIREHKLSAYFVPLLIAILAFYIGYIYLLLKKRKMKKR